MTYYNLKKPKIIIICGPTASGKTSIAIDLAKDLNGEIISADSMQIYRYMDIGTAKPTANEQSCVPHHMIDIVDPNESFDARQFAKMADEKIKELIDRDIIPFVVGGAGLYIKALVYGLFNPGPVDSKIRKRLNQKGKLHGSNFLHRKLKKCDPYAAQRIHPNDTFRIIRALEIYKMSGKPISELHHEHRFMNKPYEVLKIGLIMGRDLLYDRINKRVDEMIESGFVKEVKGLLKKGYSTELKSMQSIGYRHMNDFIEERSSWNEMVRTLKRDTRRYAKRQFTWFKADSDILWTEPKQMHNMQRLIKKFLQAD